MFLYLSALLELSVSRGRQKAAHNLRNNIGCGIVQRNGFIVEHHDRHGRVEVSAADGTPQEDETCQGCTDRQPVAGRYDDRQENKRAQEFNKDRQEVHVLL